MENTEIKIKVMSVTIWKGDNLVDDTTCYDLPELIGYLCKKHYYIKDDEYQITVDTEYEDYEGD